MSTTPFEAGPRGAARADGASRRMRRSATCLAIAAALSACVLDPPPTREEIRTQTGTLDQLPLDQPWKAAPNASTPIQDNWLLGFQDPQLDVLVAEALANNPDLRVAATRLEQAAQYVELAKAQLRPAINLLGIGGANLGGGDVTSALQGASLGVSWEPDLWGRLRYAREAAVATQASVAADYEFSRQSLAAAVARGWFTATETWLQLQLADQAVASATALVDVAALRMNVGAGSEQDLVAARTTRAAYEDAARQVRLSHGQALRALELLLGRYPAAELQARTTFDDLPGPVPAGLPLQMLERRPDMVAAERRVAAAFNRVGEAQAARLPRIVLSANVATLNSDILELKDDYEDPSAGAGAKLLAPFYRGGELVTQVQIRTLEQKEAVADYARMALRALGDVEDSLASGEALADRRAILARALADNEYALQLSETRYRIGRTDLREVEQNRLNVQAARQALLRVQSEQLSERTRLHLALGGSFEAPPPEVGEGEGVSVSGDDSAAGRLAAAD